MQNCVFVAFSPFFLLLFLISARDKYQRKKNPYLPPPQNPNLEEKKKRKELNFLTSWEMKDWRRRNASHSLCCGANQKSRYHQLFLRNSRPRFVSSAQQFVIFPFSFCGYATTKKVQKCWEWAREKCVNWKEMSQRREKKRSNGGKGKNGGRNRMN